MIQKIYSLKKTYKILITGLLIILSYGFIYFKIKGFIKTNDFASQAITIQHSNLLLLLIVSILMPFNWLLESIKWEILIQKIQPITLLQSFKAVISGITIGLATPNRIGEIGGRTLFIKKGKRSYAAIATWIGSYSQFIVTISIGTASLIIYLFFYKRIESILLHYSVAFVLIIFFMLNIWFYYKSDKLLLILVKIPLLKTKLQQIGYLKKISTADLSKIIFFSLFRFLIFSTQYYLLLIFFNISISCMDAYISISLIYLFSTLIPTTTIAELGIRSSFAVFFIGVYSENILGIILASFTLWIINLAIPAILGSFFLFKNKF